MNIQDNIFIFQHSHVLSPQGPTWQSLSCSSLISVLLLRQTLVIPSIVNITINIVTIVIILINIIVVVITNNMVNVTIVFTIFIIIVVVIIIINVIILSSS